MICVIHFLMHCGDRGGGTGGRGAGRPVMAVTLEVDATPLGVPGGPRPFLAQGCWRERARGLWSAHTLTAGCADGHTPQPLVLLWSVA